MIIMIINMVIILVMMIMVILLIKTMMIKIIKLMMTTLLRRHTRTNLFYKPYINTSNRFVYICHV